jgi:hypothetical protein
LGRNIREMHHSSRQWRTLHLRVSNVRLTYKSNACYGKACKVNACNGKACKDNACRGNARDG